MKFSDVIGQEGIKSRLTRSVREQRVPHALMLLGQGGSGNFPLALAFAQYVLCENRGADDSCGSCPSCHKAGQLAHPDLHFVFPVTITRSVTRNPVSDDFIGEWRNFVSEEPYILPQKWYEFIGIGNKQGIINVYESAAVLKKLSLRSFESEYRIVIVWLPEKMNRPAANKLLKMLEEPPLKTLFILVAERTDDMLPTVLSRTQIFRVPAIESGALQAYLEAKFPDAAGQAKAAADLSGGDVLRAVEYLQSSAGTEEFLEMFMKMMRLAYLGNPSGMLDFVDEMADYGREKQKSYLLFALRMVRENFLLNINEKELTVMNAKEREFSEKFSDFVTVANINGIYRELNLAYGHIEANGYDRIVFLDLCLKLARLMQSARKVGRN